MYYDTFVSQREMLHGSTGSSGSGREFWRWIGWRKARHGENGLLKKLRTKYMPIM